LASGIVRLPRTPIVPATPDRSDHSVRRQAR
jgi:hypothetical protein